MHISTYTVLIAFSGCSEMLMACAINEEAAKTPGKEAVAMESFVRALQTLPTTIADNGGLDTAQLISELRAEHAIGKHTAGLGNTQIANNFLWHLLLEYYKKELEVFYFFLRSPNY